MRIHNFLFSLFILGITLYSLWSVWKIVHSPTLQDLQVYYTAAQDLHTGHNPYLNQENNFVYPPSSFFFLWPMGFLSYPQIIVAWTIGSWLAIVLSVWFITRMLTMPFSKYFFGAVLCLAFLSFPFKFTLGMGQVNCYVLLMTTLAVFYFWQNKNNRAGFFLGLAIAVKVFPVVLLLFFIRKKQAWPVLIAALTFAALHLPAILQFGTAVLPQYYLHLFFQLSGGGNWAYYNQSLNGLLTRMHLLPTLALIIQILITVFLWSVAFFTTTSQKKVPSHTLLTEWSLLTCSWLITISVSWQHYFVFLLPAFALMVQDLQQRRGRVVVAVIAYLLVSANIPNFSAHFPFDFMVYSHVLFGTILFFWYLRKSRSPQQTVFNV